MDNVHIDTSTSFFKKMQAESLTHKNKKGTETKNKIYSSLWKRYKAKKLIKTYFAFALQSFGSSSPSSINWLARNFKKIYILKFIAIIKNKYFIIS